MHLSLEYTTMHLSPTSARHLARPHWSPQEVAELRDLLEEGYGVVNAARLFAQRNPARTVRGAISKATALLLPMAPRTVSIARVRSQTEVAALMGVQPRTVRDWINHGWLDTTRTRRRRRHEKGGPTKLIHDTSLHAMLLLREAWPGFNPARITDPDWRYEAEQARAAAGGDWRRMTDVLREQGYVPGLVVRFLRQYPGELRRATWKAAIYVWSGDLPAFVAWLHGPQPRPKRGAQ